MTFNAQEVSNEDGRPIVFYRFSLTHSAEPGEGASLVTYWHYCTAEENIQAGGFTWLATPMSDDGPRQTGESASDALVIDCPDTIGPCAIHKNTPPSRPIQVRVFRKHEDDDELISCYAGEISQINFPMVGHAKISCETLSASMQRDGLRIVWQRNCPYALYDDQTCKVIRSSYEVNSFVQKIVDSLYVYVTTDLLAFPQGYFDGGFIKWVHPVRGNEYRMIERQVQGHLQMFAPIEELYAGMPMFLYPGCDRTTEMCNSRFDNLMNFGGAPHMPGKSPFDGDPIF